MSKLNETEKFIRDAVALGVSLMFKPIPNEGRILVLDKLRTIFCFECGRDLEDGEVCHCSNDE